MRSRRDQRRRIGFRRPVQVRADHRGDRFALVGEHPTWFRICRQSRVLRRRTMRDRSPKDQRRGAEENGGEEQEWQR